MINKDIHFKKEARDRLKRGIDAVADAVKETLGPNGKNVAIDQATQPLVTNDGVSVAHHITLKDRTENMGAEIIKEVARNTDDEVGDGTTTSIVLTQAIINEGLKHLNDDGSNGLELKRGIDKATEQVISLLDKASKPVKDLKRVASISAESEEIGEKVADIVKMIGVDGVVSIEQSFEKGIHPEVVPGLKIDRGLTSLHFINDNEKNVAEYSNIPVLLSREKITSVMDILPLMERIAKSGKKKELVIIAEDFSQEVIATLVLNKKQGIFSTVAIKAPGFADKKEHYYEDMNGVLGGEIFSEDLGIKLEEFEGLGFARKITVHKEHSVILGADNKRIKAHVSILKSQQKADKYPESFDKRISALESGIAKIGIGAATETEYKYLELKIEDAIKATQAAMSEGVVRGGGVELFEIAKKIDNPIISKAIQVPYGIIKSSKEGVIDPVKVTKTAIKNASSAAGMFLTTSVTLTKIVEKEA